MKSMKDITKTFVGENKMTIAQAQKKYNELYKTNGILWDLKSVEGLQSLPSFVAACESCTVLKTCNALKAREAFEACTAFKALKAIFEGLQSFPSLQTAEGLHSSEGGVRQP